MDSFGEKRENSKNSCLLATFELNLAQFLTSQLYKFDAKEQFLKKLKEVEKLLFVGHFWANFGYVSRISAIQF